MAKEYSYGTCIYYKNELDNSIKKILIVHPDIVEITYFESYIQNRKYHLTARFKTVYSETIEVTL